VELSLLPTSLSLRQREMALEGSPHSSVIGLAAYSASQRVSKSCRSAASLASGPLGAAAAAAASAAAAATAAARLVEPTGGTWFR